MTEKEKPAENSEQEEIGIANTILKIEAGGGNNICVEDCKNVGLSDEFISILVRKGDSCDNFVALVDVEPVKDNGIALRVYGDPRTAVPTITYVIPIEAIDRRLRRMPEKNHVPEEETWVQCFRLNSVQPAQSDT